jgi:hypothetical protein
MRRLTPDATAPGLIWRCCCESHITPGCRLDCVSFASAGPQAHPVDLDTLRRPSARFHLRLRIQGQPATVRQSHSPPLLGDPIQPPPPSSPPSVYRFQRQDCGAAHTPPTRRGTDDEGIASSSRSSTMHRDS